MARFAINEVSCHVASLVHFAAQTPEPQPKITNVDAPPDARSASITTARDAKPAPALGAAPRTPRDCMAASLGVYPDARRLPGGFSHRDRRAGPDAVRGLLPPADGRHHSGLPPLL